MRYRHVPAFRILTDVETSASAIEQWRRQYSNWPSERRFADGRSKAEVEAELQACERKPSDISRILNASWSTPRCDFCEQHATVVAQFGGEYGGTAVSCCVTCAKAIHGLLAQFPRSADPVGEPPRPLPAGELP